jgi:hypothetical protein
MPYFILGRTQASPKPTRCTRGGLVRNFDSLSRKTLPFRSWINDSFNPDSFNPRSDETEEATKRRRRRSFTRAEESLIKDLKGLGVFVSLHTLACF